MAFDQAERPLETALFDGVFRLEDWLPYEFSYVANRVSATLERMYTERFGLSVPGWRIVAVLANHAPLSASEVAERTAMSKVDITRAVTQLLKLGMVLRRTDRADRRRVILRLSAKGTAAYREVLPLAIAIERRLLSDLSKNEIEALKKTMSRIARKAATTLSDAEDWRALLNKH
jgi:DNA-binding MarR family transcriptional regulator